MAAEEARGTPAVSVVIPARNAGSTLADQLAALSRQTFTDPWETLVCDNGSTDDTAAIVAEWQKLLPGLRRVDASAGVGAGGTRNVGVEHAAAPLIAFCDADDVVADEWLAEIARGLASHDAIACLSELSLLNPHRPDGESSGPVYRYDALPQFAFASSRAFAATKAALQAVGGFDPAVRIGEDTDLSWRLQLAGIPLLPWPSAVVHVRERDEFWATLRQWYEYGRAEKLLARRFARVPREAALPSDDSPAPALDQPAAPHGSALSRRLRRLTRMRGWRDIRPLLQRRSRWLGLRFGRPDASIPVYDGPGATPPAN
ncbi:hypothetical protein GCM10009775_10020 [Microbacterium aoyamense]|uniref:Glycosyltransferase 2-like domain-containing protein n=1 Tax=Microbacterium aoyamense TaxID=344166 RepID=A0ABP5ATR0_9MICO|nr:glycosyltransferase [Microbacterium aoyamense]